MTERIISYCSELFVLLLPLKTAADLVEDGEEGVFSALCVFELEGFTTSEDVILYVELLTEEPELEFEGES